MSRCNDSEAYVIGEDIEYDPVMFPRELQEGSYIDCYRYMDGYWIDALENSHLKLSLAKDFNDVFDCAGRPCIGKLDPQVIAKHWQEDPTLQMFLALHSITGLDCFDYKKWTPSYAQDISRSIQDKRMVQQILLLCFASPSPVDYSADILMWSYYTDKWKGVRLGFKLLFENHKLVTYNVTSPYYLTHVKYDKNRPCLNMDKLKSLTDPDFLKYYIALCNTKSPAWQHENEWRLSVLPRFAETQVDSQKELLYFWQFHKSLLKTVDIGPNMSPEMRAKTIAETRKLYPHVIIRDAVPDNKEYKINYIEIEKP